MNPAWKKNVIDLKWHALGLLWFVCAIAAGMWAEVSGEHNALTALASTGSKPIDPLKKDDAAPTLPMLKQSIAAAQLPALTHKSQQNSRTVPEVPVGVRLWEASPVKPMLLSGKEPPLTPAPWRIAGVFEAAQGKQVIVEYPNQLPEMYLKVGDVLPNEAQILTVSHQRITVRTKVAGQWKTIALDF